MCRDGIRKAKAQMELNLAWDMKNSKKGFCRYIGRRRQAKESVSPLINETGELASSDMEKAEVLNKCFASVFTGGQVSYVCQYPEAPGEGERSRFHPTVTAEQVRDCLMKWDRERWLMWLSSCSPSYLKNHELSGEVPGDWRKGNMTPIFEKGLQGRPGELWAGEPHLCAWEDHGADPPGRHAKACTR